MTLNLQTMNSIMLEVAGELRTVRGRRHSWRRMRPSGRAVSERAVIGHLCRESHIIKEGAKTMPSIAFTNVLRTGRGLGYLALIGA